MKQSCFQIVKDANSLRFSSRYLHCPKFVTVSNSVCSAAYGRIQSSFDVTGTILGVSGVPDGLGTNLVIQQKTGATAHLVVDAGSNIKAAGKFQIDIGTVKLTASGGTYEALTGAGLFFGNANNTFLTIVDSTFGTRGGVAVRGLVTLGQNTTTTMNYKGATNTAAMTAAGIIPVSEDLCRLRLGTLC